MIFFRLPLSERAGKEALKLKRKEGRPDGRPEVYVRCRLYVVISQCRPRDVALPARAPSSGAPEVAGRSPPDLRAAQSEERFARQGTPAHHDGHAAFPYRSAGRSPWCA